MRYHCLLLIPIHNIINIITVLRQSPGHVTASLQLDDNTLSLYQRLQNDANWYCIALYITKKVLRTEDWSVWRSRIEVPMKVVILCLPGMRLVMLCLPGMGLICLQVPCVALLIELVDTGIIQRHKRHKRHNSICRPVAKHVNHHDQGCR